MREGGRGRRKVLNSRGILVHLAVPEVPLVLLVPRKVWQEAWQGNHIDYLTY